MKIGMVYGKDVFQRASWSGTPLGVATSLLKEHSVTWIKPRCSPVYAALIALLSAVQRVCLRLGGCSFAFKRLPFMLKLNARRFEIDDDQYDCIVSIGVTHVAFLNTTLPIVSVVDAVFEQFDGYYSKRNPKWMREIANRIEKESLSKSWRIIAVSDWVRTCIRDYYNIPSSKIVMWQLGANIADDFMPKSKTFPPLVEELKLLFIGIDLMRKGLDVAIDTVAMLRSKYNCNVSLTVVGADSFRNRDPASWVTFEGKLNKEDRKQLERFSRLIEAAHVFILPTRAECAGMVFAEASAYGLPVFTYDTGGVGSYVINDYNGWRLPLSATADDFAKAIYKRWADNAFAKSSQNGIEFFGQSLSWTLWPSRFRNLFSEKTW